MLRTTIKKPVKKKVAAKFADSELVKTQGLAARYVDKSTRTIRRWVKEGMTRTEDGYYWKALLDHYKTNEGSEPTEAKKKGQTADADYKDAKARLMQMELRVKEGELVPLAEIEQGRVRRILAVKRALLRMPRTLAPQLAKIRDERKVQKIINEQVKAIIEAFSN